MPDALTELEIRKALTKIHGSFTGFRDLNSYEDLRATAVGYTDQDKAAGVPAVTIPSEAELRAALSETSNDLSSAKGEAYRIVMEEADAATAEIDGIIPKGEVYSWAIKEASARAHAAEVSQPHDLLILQSEVELTGESLEDLVTLILAKADKYRVLSGKVAGFRRVFTKRIDDAESVNEVRQVISEAEAFKKIQLKALIDEATQ